MIPSQGHLIKLEKEYQDKFFRIAEFNNYSLTGIHFDNDDDFLISGRSYPQHYVLTNELNYTNYCYTDHENLLLFCQIGCQYDVTLDYIFDIGKFSGHIMLEDTNLALKPSADIGTFIVIISSISIICVFIVILIFNRRKLVSNDMPY